METLAKKIVGKNKVLPVLEYFKVNNGIAEATDMECTVKWKTDISGTGLVPKDYFKIKQKTVKFESDNICYINSSKFTTPQLSEFPVSDQTFRTIGTLSAKDIPIIIGLSKICSKDVLRVSMQGVFFNNNVVCSTDAIRLSHREIESNIQGSFIIPAKYCSFLIPGIISISDDNSHIKVENDTNCVIIRLIDAMFPDYKVVIPTKDMLKHKLILDKKTFKQALQDCLICNPLNDKVTMSLKEGLLNLYSENIDFDANSEASISYEGSIIDIAFNLKYMLSLLDIIEYDNIVIETYESDRPMLINSNNLLMPIML